MSCASKKNFSLIRDTFITQHFWEFAMHCLHTSVDFVCAKMLILDISRE